MYFKFKYLKVFHAALLGTLSFMECPTCLQTSELSLHIADKSVCLSYSFSTLRSFLMLMSFLLFLQIYDLLITWRSETHCISTVDPLLVHKSKSS